MAEFSIVFARSARKELESLDSRLAARILAAIDKLSANPAPAGSRKLHNSADLWRIRVGDYRVIYSYDLRRRVIDVNAVRHRSSAYR